MGICSSNSRATNHTQVVNPQNDTNHAAIEAQYGDLLNPENPSNLNKKYDYLYSLDKSTTTGQGIKKTFGYKAKVSQEVVMKKRVEFWETRIEGKKETWNALKLACTSDDTATSLAVLQAAGIKLIKKTLQMSYDVHGYRYDIPVFVINAPTSYEAEEKVEEVLEDKDIELKIRCKGFETVIKAHTTESMEDVEKKFRSEFDKVTDGESIRFFFSGKELKKERKLGNYVKEDCVLIGFFRKND